MGPVLVQMSLSPVVVRSNSSRTNDWFWICGSRQQNLIESTALCCNVHWWTLWSRYLSTFLSPSISLHPPAPQTLERGIIISFCSLGIKGSVQYQCNEGAGSQIVEDVGSAASPGSLFSPPCPCPGSRYVPASAWIPEVASASSLSSTFDV